MWSQIQLKPLTYIDIFTPPIGVKTAMIKVIFRRVPPGGIKARKTVNKAFSDKRRGMASKAEQGSAQHEMAIR